MAIRWNRERLRIEQQAMRERQKPKALLEEVAVAPDEPEPEMPKIVRRRGKAWSKSCRNGNHKFCQAEKCGCPHHEQDQLGI